MKKRLLPVFLTIIGTVVVVFPRFVQAGNDIYLNCSGQGGCLANPDNAPLFQEVEWLPGSSVTQKLTVTNDSARKSKIALRLQNYQDPRDLGRTISLAIHENVPNGKVLYSVPSLQTLSNENFFSFDTVNPYQTKAYFFTSVMSASAGAEFQSAKLQFDTQFGLEFAPVVTKKIFAPKTDSVIAAALVQPTQLPQAQLSVQQEITTDHPVSASHCSLWVRYLPELVFALWVSVFFILQVRFPQYRDWMIPLLSFAFLTTALSVWYFWHICVG